MAALFVAGGVAVDWLEAGPAMANGAWGGYSNGQIPLSALDIIDYPGVQPWHYSSAALSEVYMAPGASDRLVQLLTAYHVDTGGYLRVAEGYRTLAGQQWLYDHDNGGTVGQSNHGWGQAVDFDSGLLTSAQASWLATNGDTYHFFPLSGDYGHYNYTGPITPPAATTLEDDMPIMLYNVNAGVTRRAFYTPGSPIHMIDASNSTLVTTAIDTVKSLRKAPASTPTADVTANLTTAQWDFLVGLEGTAP